MLLFNIKLPLTVNAAISWFLLVFEFYYEKPFATRLLGTGDVLESLYSSILVPLWVALIEFIDTGTRDLTYYIEF